MAAHHNFCIDDPPWKYQKYTLWKRKKSTLWKRQKYYFSTRIIKKRVINGAKDFAEYANKIINGISCLYLAENEIMAEPQDIEVPPKIPRTSKVYKVLKTYIEDNVCKIEF